MSLPLRVAVGGRQTVTLCGYQLLSPALLFSTLLLLSGSLCKKVSSLLGPIFVSALCFSSFRIFLTLNVATRMIYTSASPVALT